MEVETVEYSWTDGNVYSFMNMATFEEVQIPKEELDDAEWLYEGMKVQLSKYKNEVIGIQMPRQANYDVVGFESSKQMKGEKCAILNSGAQVMVPSFVNQGMKIRVEIEDRRYVDKVDGFSSN